MAHLEWTHRPRTGDSLPQERWYDLFYSPYSDIAHVNIAAIADEIVQMSQGSITIGGRFDNPWLVVVTAAQVTTTQRYLATDMETLFDRMQQHYRRPRVERVYHAGYDPEDVEAVFGG